GAGVLRMLRECDAFRGRAGAGADDDGNAAVDVLYRSCGRSFHFLGAEGAVASGAAEQADPIDAILDLVVDGVEQARMIDRVAIVFRWRCDEGEHARPEIVKRGHCSFLPACCCAVRSMHWQAPVLARRVWVAEVVVGTLGEEALVAALQPRWRQRDAKAGSVRH